MVAANLSKEGEQTVTSVADKTERITDVFLRLGEDPALLSEFERDPRAVLEASGLSESQVSTVLTGDAGTVRSVVADEVASDPVRRHIVVAPRMTIYKPEPEPDSEPEPEPDPEPESEPEERHAAEPALA